MNKAETRAELIGPALKAAGWGLVEGSRIRQENVWLTQKLMAALFEVTVPTGNEQLADLYGPTEISEPATIRDFRTVQKAERKIPMTIPDWAMKLDAFLHGRHYPVGGIICLEIQP